METLELSPFLDGLKFGEGPRWHDGRLWLSDIEHGRVLAVDGDGQLDVVVETEGPSGLGWLPDGRLVISTLGKSHLLVVDGGEVTILHDLSELGPTLNDMVGGPMGESMSTSTGGLRRTSRRPVASCSPPRTGGGS